MVRLRDPWFAEWLADASEGLIEGTRVALELGDGDRAAVAAQHAPAVGAPPVDLHVRAVRPAGLVLLPHARRAQTVLLEGDAGLGLDEAAQALRHGVPTIAGEGESGFGEEERLLTLAPPVRSTAVPVFADRVQAGLLHRDLADAVRAALGLLLVVDDEVPGLAVLRHDDV